MSEKIVGYILLFSGIAVLLLSAFSVYGVFSKNIEPIQFFTIGDAPIEVPVVGQGANGGGIDIPTTTISAPLNSFAHLVLMMFIGSIGFKISSLGTMLVRPVIVKLKSKESPDKSTK